jgi:hypothetical protein
MGKNPSSGTDFVRATFSHKGRREERDFHQGGLPLSDLNTSDKLPSMLQ